jgi:hypothetical protein
VVDDDVVGGYEDVGSEWLLRAKAFGVGCEFDDGGGGGSQWLELIWLVRCATLQATAAQSP